MTYKPTYNAKRTNVPGAAYPPKYRNAPVSIGKQPQSNQAARLSAIKRGAGIKTTSRG